MLCPPLPARRSSGGKLERMSLSPRERPSTPSYSFRYTPTIGASADEGMRDINEHTLAEPCFEGHLKSKSAFMRVKVINDSVF